jgi:hypothetical protein
MGLIAEAMVALAKPLLIKTDNAVDQVDSALGDTGYNISIPPNFVNLCFNPASVPSFEFKRAGDNSGPEESGFQAQGEDRGRSSNKRNSSRPVPWRVGWHPGF